jgi:hypothetical protein
VRRYLAERKYIKPAATTWTRRELSIRLRCKSCLS